MPSGFIKRLSYTELTTIFLLIKLADLSKKAGSKTTTERQYDGRKIKSTLRLKTYAAASPIGDKYNMKTCTRQTGKD